MNEDEVWKQVGAVVSATDVAMHQRRMIASLEAIADCVQKIDRDASNRHGAMLGAAVGGVAQRYGVDRVRAVLAGIVDNEEFWKYQRDVADQVVALGGSRK
jgi:hypothetical protein